MEISIDKKQMYSEVYEFINLLDIQYIDKIPKKMMNFIEEQMDKEYIKNINPYEDIQKQNLRRDTIIFLSMLNLKYWCNENERQNLQKIYKENEKQYQEELMKKYNPDNIFKNDTKPKVIEPATVSNTVNENITQNIELTEIKDNFFQKIMRKIKMFLSKK